MVINNSKKIVFSATKSVKSFIHLKPDLLFRTIFVVSGTSIYKFMNKFKYK